MPRFWILSRLARRYDPSVRVRVADFSALTFFTLTGFIDGGLWCVAMLAGTSDDSNLRLIRKELLNCTHTLDERCNLVRLENDELALHWNSYSETDSPYAKAPNELLCNTLLVDKSVIAIEILSGWLLLVGRGMEAPDAPLSTVKAAMKLLPYLRSQAADERERDFLHEV